MNNIMDQAARSELLSSEMSKAILAGDDKQLLEVLSELVMACSDAHALLIADSSTTMNERRLSRQLLAVAFMVALCGERNQ